MSLRSAWIVAGCMAITGAVFEAGAAWNTVDQQNLLDARWDASYDKINEHLNRSGSAPENSHQALIWRTDDGEVEVILRRTEALLNAIQNMFGAPSMTALADELETLKQQAVGNYSSRTLFKQVCDLRRRIATKNPMLDFDTLMFTGYESTKPQFHSQQMAWFAKHDPGAGLYMVRGFDGSSPEVLDMLENTSVSNGDYAGEGLSNTNPRWGGYASFLRPELSFDARKVMFAWSPHACNCEWGGSVKKYSSEGTHRIFGMDIDGSNLRQLIDHPEGQFGKYYDDYDPCFLPSGRILFVSDRHNGGQRCGNTAVSGDFYTMKADGSDMYRISWHETNVRCPVVDHDGRVIFSRWDYVDRHAYSAQCFWIMYPDGADPRAPHGNYIEDDKPFHPISETDIRPIPNTTGKYMGIEGGHHQAYRGNVVVIDINKRAKYEEQIRFFWPHWQMGGDNPGINESERFTKPRRNFKMPWPLSEQFVIATEYSEILLLDEFGNEVLLFDCEPLFQIHAGYPLPVKPRPKPTAIQPRTYQGERYEQAKQAHDLPKATISVMNVYETDTPFPQDTKITHLRICQILGRPKNPWGTSRNVYLGWSDGTLIKHVIGTVPVEEDGSAFFQAPIEREIYFQAVDSTGMAVTSMLSGTFVHPGEHLTCLGCHEDKWIAPSPGNTPLATQRPPSEITPEVDGSYPFTYHRLVKIPVFDTKCAPCHESKNVDISFDYWDKSVTSCSDNSGDDGPGWHVGDLQDYVTYYGAAYGKWADIYCYKDGGHEGQLQLGYPGSNRSRSIPMQIGARACSLTDVLQQHEDAGKTDLTYEEFHRITLWMDMNCQEMATYELTDDARARQEAGEEVWPSWNESGMDPANPTGIQLEGDYWEGASPVGGIERTRWQTGHFPAPSVAFRQGSILVSELPPGVARIVVCDMSGRVVAQRRVENGTSRRVASLPVDCMGPGMYLTRVQSRGREWVTSSIVGRP